MKIVAMYKNELVRAAGVSAKDFRKWLAIPKHQDALRKLGVSPTAHKLPPIAVQYIIDNYGISLERGE